MRRSPLEDISTDNGGHCFPVNRDWKSASSLAQSWTSSFVTISPTLAQSSWTVSPRDRDQLPLGTPAKRQYMTPLVTTQPKATDPSAVHSLSIRCSVPFASMRLNGVQSMNRDGKTRSASRLLGSETLALPRSDAKPSRYSNQGMNTSAKGDGIVPDPARALKIDHSSCLPEIYRLSPVTFVRVNPDLRIATRCKLGNIASFETRMSPPMRRMVVTVANSGIRSAENAMASIGSSSWTTDLDPATTRNELLSSASNPLRATWSSTNASSKLRNLRPV